MQASLVRDSYDFPPFFNKIKESAERNEHNILYIRRTEVSRPLRTSHCGTIYIIYILLSFYILHAGPRRVKSLQIIT